MAARRWRSRCRRSEGLSPSRVRPTPLADAECRRWQSPLVLTGTAKGWMHSLSVLLNVTPIARRATGRRHSWRRRCQRRRAIAGRAAKMTPTTDDDEQTNTVIRADGSEEQPFRMRGGHDHYRSKVLPFVLPTTASAGQEVSCLRTGSGMSIQPPTRDYDAGLHRGRTMRHFIYTFPAAVGTKSTVRCRFVTILRDGGASAG